MLGLLSKAFRLMSFTFEGTRVGLMVLGSGLAKRARFGGGAV
jgi:hypothetical protein